MAEILISRSSWLNFTNLLEFDGKLFWDETNLPDIPFSDTDEYFQLNTVYAHRIDLLAFDKYGDAELWWAILHANNIDLPNQLYEGLTIRIPAKEVIESLFQDRSDLQ